MKAFKRARVERADVRKAEREARSDEQQLKRLDSIFGEGKGAVRERVRLLKKINKSAK